MLRPRRFAGLVNYETALPCQELFGRVFAPWKWKQ